MAEICDVCDKPVKGNVLYSIDKCTIPATGELIINETVDVCPSCLKNQPEKIYGIFLS